MCFVKVVTPSWDALCSLNMQVTLNMIWSISSGFSNLVFSFARDAYFACCRNQRILPLCSWLPIYIRQYSNGQLLIPLPAIHFADLQPPGSSCSLISMLNLFVLGSQPSDWYKKSHPSSTNSPYLQLRLSIQSAVLEKIIIFFAASYIVNLHCYVVLSFFLYLLLFCALSLRSDQLEKVKKKKKNCFLFC